MKNVQKCCVTVSVAIPLRQNWCQGGGHVPWTDRHNPRFRGPPGAFCGKNGEAKWKGPWTNLLIKSEYLSSRSGLSYIVPTQVTFLDTVAEYVYKFVSVQKMTSDFFMLGYLTTILQLGTMGRKCVKSRVQ